MIDLIQISVIGLIFAFVIGIGRLFAPYVTRVFAEAPSYFDKILDPFEKSIYRGAGINPNHSMSWKEYFLSLLIVNILQMSIAFIILIFQDRLPLNPQRFPGITWDLAFNTVVSFGTNTNLQHYNGESTLSYFSQMTAIQFLQFTSAASGLCAAVAFVRGFKSGARDVGNFYVDFVRSLTRVLFPLCFIAS